jgi:hypothetical protein
MESGTKAELKRLGLGRREQKRKEAVFELLLDWFSYANGVTWKNSVAVAPYAGLLLLIVIIGPGAYLTRKTKKLAEPEIT